MGNMTPPAMAPHAAGAKIRKWRTTNSWSARELGERLGAALGRKPVPATTVLGWEQRGKEARVDIRRVLHEWKICEPEDWLQPAAKAA
jgi:hypothetical protein